MPQNASPLFAHLEVGAYELAQRLEARCGIGLGFPLGHSINVLCCYLCAAVRTC